MQLLQIKSMFSAEEYVEESMCQEGIHFRCVHFKHISHSIALLFERTPFSHEVHGNLGPGLGLMTPDSNRVIANTRLGLCTVEPLQFLSTARKVCRL